VLRVDDDTIAAPVHGVREVCDVPAQVLPPDRSGRPDYAVAEIELDLARIPVVDVGAFIRSLEIRPRP
jgi:hypothetical protein